MKRRFKIIDIMHSGNSGEAGTSKVGSKYDERRGKVVNITFPLRKKELVIFMSDNGTPELYTTPFVRLTCDSDGYHYLETQNSVYKLEELDR